jgi:hypothetical protein
MTGSEVATQAGQVPALASTPSLEIEASDVALPRLYVGQYMSKHVQERRVPAGCWFTALGEDDPDPQVLWELDAPDKPVVHILAMRKGKSYSDGGELQLYAFDDPNAPEDAWVTYNYVVAIPEHDPDQPFKWLLTRTGQPTARQINLILVKNAARGPAHTVAFEIDTAKRENAKGEFFVPRAHQVEAKDENVAVAEGFLPLLAGAQSDIDSTSTGEEPAI